MKKPKSLKPKRESWFQRNKMYINGYTVGFMVFLILFILAIRLAIGETSWYNTPLP